MSENLLAPPPLVTADLPGIGGRIKVELEDFEVEEIPAYAPSGAGDFLYLWIEKRDLGAEFFTRQVARRLGIANGEVGTAGLKDRRAVTRQWVSVPSSAEANLSKLEGDGIRVLQTSRHVNKLRPGHLHGNRFTIVIRDVDPDSAARMPALIDRLRQHGLANFYGEQRFGRDGETLHMGLGLLSPSPPWGEELGVRGGPREETESQLPAKRPRPIRNPFLKKLALSAVQSALFNHYLAARLNDGLLRRVLPGDVMAKYPFGGMFVAEDLPREQSRFDAREIVSAGPMFGKKMFPSRADSAQREAATLSACGITRDQLAGFGKLLQGTRRHNLVYLDDLAWEKTSEHPSASALRLTFSLPAGSYATVLLRELMHNDSKLFRNPFDDEGGVGE